MHPIRFFALVFMIGGSAGTCCGQEEVPLELKIARAREHLTSAAQELETAKELHERGTVSQHRVQQLEYQHDKATLRLAILSDPKNHEANQLLEAKLDAAYATQERELAERLYERNGLSKTRLIRARYTEKLFELRLEYIKNLDDLPKSNLIQFKIASEKVKLSAHELRTTERLFMRGSKSQAEFERAKASHRLAQAELESRREVLGARAEVVDPPVPNE